MNALCRRLPLLCVLVVSILLLRGCVFITPAHQLLEVRLADAETAEMLDSASIQVLRMSCVDGFLDSDATDEQMREECTVSMSEVSQSPQALCLEFYRASSACSLVEDNVTNEVYSFVINSGVATEEVTGQVFEGSRIGGGTFELEVVSIGQLQCTGCQEIE